MNAKRVGVSISTLMRMESGDPAMSIGIYATDQSEGVFGFQDAEN